MTARSHPPSPSLPEPPSAGGTPDRPAGLEDDGRVEPCLARVVRGLGALFWALPLSVVFSAQTARTDFFGRLGFLPALAANLLLLFSLWELGRFRRQASRWQGSLFRARLLALVMVGLSPFLQWWKIIPAREHYQLAVFAFVLAGLVFLGHLSLVLVRLTELIADRALEDEARLFLGVNLPMVVAVFLGSCAVMTVSYSSWRPSLVVVLAPWFYRLGFSVLLMVLLPLALNMTLVWKVKQAILDQVFLGKR